MAQLKTHQAALGDRYAAISQLVETADWVAVYIPKELGPGAEPSAVVRADWSRAQVDALAKLDGTNLAVADNGRYTFGGQTIVLGSEASDLDDGLVLFLPRRARDAEIISQLGKGREGISEVVASADTSAPF